MADSALPPSREVFEEEILEMARQPWPHEDLAGMLRRYFCDTWFLRNDQDGLYCIHVNGNPDFWWEGNTIAHALTVALLGEYDQQIGGEGEWVPPSKRS